MLNTIFFYDFVEHLPCKSLWISYYRNDHNAQYSKPVSRIQPNCRLNAAKIFYKHTSFFFHFYLQIVYVARNARDNAVSYFHFDRMEKMQPEPGDWNSFLQRFKDGKSGFLYSFLPPRMLIFMSVAHLAIA